MKQIIFLFALLAAALTGCQNDPPPAATPPAATPPPVVPAAPPAATLPSVPLALLEDIWKTGTQVDYIFYNYPFTMSLTEQASIQHAVAHIAEEPAPLKPECKAAGRVSYQINGNIVLEGDFYFSTGCTYFVFEKNRQKIHSNYMTDEGIRYFQNQIQQALKLREQGQ